MDSVEKENSVLIGRVEELQQSLTAGESKVAELGADVDQLGEEKASLVNKMAELESHCSEMKTRHVGEVDTLEVEIDSWRTKAAEVELQLEGLTAELVEVNARLSQEATEKAAVQVELSGLAAQQVNIQRLSDMVNSLEADLEAERANGKIEDLEKQDQVQESLRLLQEEKDGLEQEVVELGEKLQDAYAQVEQTNVEKQRLSEQVSEQQVRLQEVTAHCDQATKEKRAATKEVAELQAEMTRVRTELVSSEAQAVQLEDKIKDLDQKLADAGIR